VTPDLPGFWSALSAYLVAFFFAWWWVVGVLFGIERFLERRSDRLRATMDRMVSREVRGHLITGATALAIFIAGFMAWRDELDSRVRTDVAKNELAKENQQLESMPDEVALAALRTEIEKARADYEQTRAALAAANTEIASLKARTAPRQLNAQQQQQIVSTLQRWRGAVFVRLVAIDGSSEIADYRASFADLFGSLAWAIQLELVSTSNIPAPRGLAVATRPGSAGAWLFATALREAGVPFDTFSPSQWPTEVPEIGLIVFVARRPD
jgi:hypothetical protein